VAANENAARLRKPQASALSNKTSVPVVQPINERPRVMIGGADRIENLWPRNP